MLLPLARDGNDVTGLDSSAHMLERCRAKLATLPHAECEGVELVRADMTSFELGRSYSAIFCAFNSFHHLRTAGEQVACLERCHAHLVPQGLLVLGLFNPDPAPVRVVNETDADDEPHVEVVKWTQGRSVRRWLSRCEYDRTSQCNECEMTYEIVSADGSVDRLCETFPLRAVYRFELEHLLARCGFRLVALYGDYDRSPFADESIGMIAVALRESDV